MDLHELRNRYLSGTRGCFVPIFINGIECEFVGVGAERLVFKELKVSTKTFWSIDEYLVLWRKIRDIISRDFRIGSVHPLQIPLINPDKYLAEGKIEVCHWVKGVQHYEWNNGWFVL